MFSVYLGSIYTFQVQGGLGWAAGTKTGPNDASDMLFGPYVHVFFSYLFFFITNSCIIGLTYQLLMERGSNEINGPKRCV